MLSVIIINHNTPEITKKCVECVQASQNIKFEIILINNTPADKFNFPGIKIINNKTVMTENISFFLPNKNKNTKKIISGLQ